MSRTAFDSLADADTRSTGLVRPGAREHYAVLGLLALTVALRFVYAFHYRVDSDEPQHLHVTWEWAQGLIAYRDFFDIHTPLFHILCAPFIRLIGERPDVMVFARLLDFYGIQWQYEPRTFPLSYDEKGNISEAFSPDFYLPDSDLYVELTTMKQSLVTKKNRKVRRLLELYPEIKIRLLYQKDFEDLLFKYATKSTRG